METRSMRKKAHLLSVSTTVPEDTIIAEILPRMNSVKSLLRFKSVSKSWNSLISTNKFAKSHLDKSVNDLNAVFISPFTNDNFAINHCPVDHVFSKRPRKVIQFEFSFPKKYYAPCLIGCCNGLCCILVELDYFVLLNPFTRKSYTLPTDVRYKDQFILTNGFGYDQSNDDYKVLAKSAVGAARLYSLKTNSWRTVDEFFSIDLVEGDGVFANGKLHWKSVGLEIVSFDLGNEAMSVVELPSSRHGEDLDWELGVLNGCLCVSEDHYKDGVEVWVMKEYGVAKSWSRVATLRNCGSPYDQYDIDILPYPVYISEEGKVLIVDKSTECIYNPRTKSARVLKLKNVKVIYSIDICIQSLISPFPDAEPGVPNSLVE